MATPEFTTTVSVDNLGSARTITVERYDEDDFTDAGGGTVQRIRVTGVDDAMFLTRAEADSLATALQNATP